MQPLWRTVQHLLNSNVSHRVTRQSQSWASVPEKRRLVFTQKPECECLQPTNSAY